MLVKEKSIYQFSIEFIVTFEGLMCFSNESNKSHHDWTPSTWVAF